MFHYVTNRIALPETFERLHTMPPVHDLLKSLITASLYVIYGSVSNID